MARSLNKGKNRKVYVKRWQNSQTKIYGHLKSKANKKRVESALPINIYKKKNQKKSD